MNQTYTDEEIERCTLRGQRDIIFQLRTLAKRRDRLTVTFNEGQQSFLTVLIDTSEERDSLYLDVGGSADINRAFLNAEHSVFTAFVDGIRYQFTSGRARETTLGGDRVFAVPLPRALLRLQRREYYRLALPMVKPYICRIRRGTPQEKPLPLHDISVGGVGVLSPEPLDYEPLERLENCWIDLRDSGVLAVTLEVRYFQTIENKAGKTHWHMGCQFIGLSSLNETLIQRFMARIEAERRALGAG